MILALLLCISVNTFGNFNFYRDQSFQLFDPDIFSKKLTEVIFNSDNTYPSHLALKEREYKIEYTINTKLEKFIKKQLRRYRSDYASVVVIDNKSGKILSAIDYNKKRKKFGNAITFSSTNPAASIFKVITAADLLETTSVNKDTFFSFNGKASTLYKNQLKNKLNRWTRKLSLKKAFAYSNNVIFGKAALQELPEGSLPKMAKKFGFSKSILQFLNVGSSHMLVPESEYNRAELASGFNKKTLISPIHGAVIASIIANDGLFQKPYLVSSVSSDQNSRQVWSPERVYERSISKETAQELKEMMKLTIKSGTARAAFRPWKIKKLKKYNLELGGKTGSITGGMPFGKRDWFIAYAKPKNNAEDKGVSICVMIVNVKKWYVKSTFLAKNIIQYYYDGLNK